MSLICALRIFPVCSVLQQLTLIVLWEGFLAPQILTSVVRNGGLAFLTLSLMTNVENGGRGGGRTGLAVRLSVRGFRILWSQTSIGFRTEQALTARGKFRNLLLHKAIVHQRI